MTTFRDAIHAPDASGQGDREAIEISIAPVWTIRHDGERQFDLLLLNLLQGIQDTGRLTDAARRARISYRHAWNVIEQWRSFFRSPLVAMSRGRGTRLTPLGQKLLWAGQRVHAQLEPQLENLSAELARALNEALTTAGPPLRAHASHDFVVARLRELLTAAGRATLDLQYRGSIDALASLRRGSCELAGFHLADGPLGEEIMGTYAKWMKPDLQRLIWFVSRVQGLIVAPGNPKAVAGVADLARPGLRFVNRQRGSGTRTLLDSCSPAPASTARGSRDSRTRSSRMLRSRRSSPAGLPTLDSGWRQPPPSSGSASCR